MRLRKAGANWVEGDRFFDRKAELEVLTERVRDGAHTLLTAQRRMGKTSLVRELLHRLAAERCFETIFVDLEDAGTPADAIAEIAAQSKSAQSVWRRVMPAFANVLHGVCDRIDTLALSEVRICLVPHHVQRFFDNLHVHLRRVGRREASLEDVEQVYTGEMLGVRGQVDMDHYESRLKLVLGSGGYGAALAMLTEAAVSGGVLHQEAIDQYREYFRTGIETEAETETEPVQVEEVLLVLEHDGYPAPRSDDRSDDYRFVSGLLEDWWRTRHGRHFVPVGQRLGAKGR